MDFGSKSSQLAKYLDAGFGRKPLIPDCILGSNFKSPWKCQGLSSMRRGCICHVMQASVANTTFIGRFQSFVKKTEKKEEKILKTGKKKCKSLHTT